MEKQTSNFIDSKETLPLREEIGGLIVSLEMLSGKVHDSKGLDIKPGLDIRLLPEYVDAVCALSNLRESAAKKYHEQNNIPL